MSVLNVKGIVLGVAMLAALTAGAQEIDGGGKPYTIQALLGGVRYNDLEFNSTDGTDSVKIDMSTLPQLGGVWATRPNGERNFSFGLEASFLLGFKLDDLNSYDGGNNVYVTVSSNLWTFDFAGGVYANAMLGSKLRLYAGAGPLMMLALYETDRSLPNNFVAETDSANEFGFGAYARGGIEFEVHPHGHLGAGVRGSYCNIDFGGVGGPSELSGLAAFVTYTAGL